MQNDIIFRVVIFNVVIAILLFSIMIMLVYYFSKRLLAQQAAAFKLIIETQENERQRIGRDLHDNLGPLLAGIMAQWEAQKDTPTESLDLSKLITSAIKSVREAAHQLVPYSLSRYGLTEATDELAGLFSTQKTKFHSKVAGKEFSIESNAQVNLYRIIQELFNNCLKHAQATQCSILFSFTDERLTITYTDNGIGIPQDNLKNGIGIKNIKSRAMLYNSVPVFSDLNIKGTQITVSFLKKHLQ